MRITSRRTHQRGSALLAVLWLSAALSAIAFSVAATVGGETERASTTSDGVRAYFLATSSVERAALWMFWGLSAGYGGEDGRPLYYESPTPQLTFEFPAGRATVDIIPESGKLNVNTASANDLNAMMLVLGLDPGRAQAVTAGIIQWRTAADAANGESNISAGGSSFQPRHASLEELEEILLIPGMTPDLFYGRYDHDPSGRLIPRGGLRDCLTVWGAGTKIDVNTAPPALLEAIGVPPQAVAIILAQRVARPFTKIDELAGLVGDPGVLARLGVGGSSIWTLRATARVRTANGGYSDLRKTVAAVIKLLDPAKFNEPYHILRWYDDAWSPTMQDAPPGGPSSVSASPQ